MYGYNSSTQSEREVSACVCSRVFVYAHEYDICAYLWMRPCMHCVMLLQVYDYRPEVHHGKAGSACSAVTEHGKLFIAAPAKEGAAAFSTTHPYAYHEPSVSMRASTIAKKSQLWRYACLSSMFVDRRKQRHIWLLIQRLFNGSRFNGGHLKTYANSQ